MSSTNRTYWLKKHYYICSAEAKATVNWVRESQISQPRTSKTHLTTITHCITFKTGFHVRSRCLKVGRVPRGLFPGAWVGAADLLGLVSHTKTVLKIKGNIIVFLFLFLAIKNARTLCEASVMTRAWGTVYLSRHGVWLERRNNRWYNIPSTNTGYRSWGLVKN